MSRERDRSSHADVAVRSLKTFTFFAFEIIGAAVGAVFLVVAFCPKEMIPRRTN
jgi:hypothetical protein